MALLSYESCRDILIQIRPIIYKILMAFKINSNSNRGLAYVVSVE